MIGGIYRIKGLHSYSLLATCDGEQYSGARKYQDQFLFMGTRYYHVCIIGHLYRINKLLAIQQQQMNVFRTKPCTHSAWSAHFLLLFMLYLLQLLFRHSFAIPVQWQLAILQRVNKVSGSGNNCWINYFYQHNSSFLVTASFDRCRLKSSAAPNLSVESAVIRDIIAHKKKVPWSHWPLLCTEYRAVVNTGFQPFYTSYFRSFSACAFIFVVFAATILPLKSGWVLLKIALNDKCF